MIRVVLVAPSPALRAGLRSLLSTDSEISIISESNRLQADEMTGEADVVVTAAASPVFGLEDADAPWSIPMLFLTDEPLGPRILAGNLIAWGALPQETTAAELSAAVHALANGLVVGTRQLLFGAESQDGNGSPLTEREAEVLEWLAKGLANKQIAAELGISEHTVKFHVSSIYTKLYATNRTQAVREGLRNGWILL